MASPRMLGLVGGLGVAATVYYYQKIASILGDSLQIVISHGLPRRIYEYVQAEDPDGLVEYLNGYLHSLKAAGADIAVIPAVTPHYCIAKLRAASPLPLISIFDPLLAELSRRGVQRVAIFGTRFVIESSLFGQLVDIDVVMPQPDEIDLIHSIYAELSITGKGTEEQHHALTQVAQSLIERDQAEIILFAGTDLSVLFNETNIGFPSLDCADLHIQAIAQELAG